MRQISVRFDDICPTMNYEKFELANNALREIGIKPLLGVVPECKDPELLIEQEHSDFWTYIRELQKQGYIIAMHGYTHFCDTHGKGVVNDSPNSEFVGLPYEVQFERIRKGKEVLLQHGITTNIFFAPSHSYDRNTLKALKANGFRYISDGKSCKPYVQEGIICIPCRSTGIPRIKNRGSYLLVLHTNQWVRSDKRHSEESFLNICKQHRLDMVDFSCFMSEPCGFYMIQKIEEWVYIWYKKRFYPLASTVYQRIKLIFKVIVSVRKSLRH